MEKGKAEVYENGLFSYLYMHLNDNCYNYKSLHPESYTYKIYLITYSI